MRLALIRWRRGASSWLIWLLGLVSLAAWSGVVCAQFAAPSAVATRTTALLYQIDPTGRLSLPELLARPATHWQAMPPNGSLGYRPDVIWFHARWSVPPHAAGQRWVLEIANPVLDDAEVWVQGRAADGRAGPWQHWRVGDKLPFDQRPITAQHFALPIGSSDMASLSVYIRVATSSSMQLPLRLLGTEEFERSERTRSTLFGVYVGLMAGLFIYNLVIWAVVRERQYGWYVGWLFTFTLFVLSLDGFTFQYLWPEATQWNDRVLILLLGTSVVMASCFMNEFLATDSDLPPLSRPVTLEALWLFPAVLVATALPYSTGIRMAIALSLLLLLRAQIQIVMCIRRGSRPARILMAAFVPVSLGGVVLATQRFGLTEYGVLTQHGPMVGSAIEVILLSLALGERLIHARQVATSAAKLATLNESLSNSNAALTTSRELAEERLAALARLQERLRLETEARDRERLRFLASAVHDLKQPLQAIASLLLPLEHALAHHDQAHATQMLGLARQATMGMSNQLTALLDLSRLESGMEPAELQPLALGAFIEGLMPQFELLAQRLGVRLSVQVPAGLTVQSDPQLLARVITNLTTNGIKYCDARRAPDCRVDVTAQAGGHGQTLVISDNGLGIPACQLSSGAIYQPFFQGYNHLPEEIKGVGLGLSIVSAAMRLLPQHHLQLVSEAGTGTTFTLTLPAGRAAPALAELRGGLSPTHAQHLAGCYVLVVEDDYLVRESMVHLLNSQQILTDAYPSVDALAQAIGRIERTPDGVLCDYRLPGGRTAHDVAAMILAHFESVPFLTVSAERLEAGDFPGLDLVAVCAKPINAEELIKTLAELLMQGAARRARGTGRVAPP
jgi:signal transduction histidine kinase